MDDDILRPGAQPSNNLLLIASPSITSTLNTSESPPFHRIILDFPSMADYEPGSIGYKIAVG